MDPKYKPLEEKAMALGAGDAKLMDTKDVAFDPRSYLKCRFGCNRWGKYWTCPPNLNLGPETFHEAFDRYSTALVVSAPDPKKSQEITLELEKLAMLEHGSMFAMALVLCVMCDECAFPEPCRFPHKARPSMDAYGMDIGATVAPLGMEVKFDQDGKLLPSWYSMVLLD
ncbi:MAG: DUF2284 domain-containing protein [Deltaproteobacteria bacterium]|nr:DUF2284 domain-containing protein [Deltaproteobacteria bacterium]